MKLHNVCAEQQDIHCLACCSCFTLVTSFVYVPPQLEDVYAEIHRVLKPGALFASYEWVATAKFDAANPDHVRIMDEINYGNGLPVRHRCGRAPPLLNPP